MKRSRMTASWAAVNASRTPKLNRPARNRTASVGMKCPITSSVAAISVELTIETGAISVRRFSFPNACGSICRCPIE